MEIKKYGLYKSKIENDIVKEGELITECQNIVQLLSELHTLELFELTQEKYLLNKFSLIKPELENDGDWIYLVWRGKTYMYCWALSEMK